MGLTRFVSNFRPLVMVCVVPSALTLQLCSNWFRLHSEVRLHSYFILMCRVATMSCYPSKNVEEIVAQQRYQTTDDLKQAVRRAFHRVIPQMLRNMSHRTWRRITTMVEHKRMHWTINVCVTCCKMCYKVNRYCSCMGNNL
jgi:hypothetical protein